MQTMIYLQKVAIPVGDSDARSFEAPDLVPAWDYYPNFLKYAEKPIPPAKYLEQILAIVKETGKDRTKLLQEFSYYIGDFVSKMEEYYELFKAYEQKNK